LPRGFAQAKAFVHMATAPGRLQDDEVLFAHSSLLYRRKLCRGLRLEQRVHAKVVREKEPG
jgi:hypothetical protein